MTRPMNKDELISIAGNGCISLDLNAWVMIHAVTDEFVYVSATRCYSFAEFSEKYTKSNGEPFTVDVSVKHKPITKESLERLQSFMKEEDI